MIGGGLAGLAAAMKLAELGIEVDLVSMVPVKRSHSVCAQGGINSVNDHTRALGDTEYLHLDVAGGDDALFQEHLGAAERLGRLGDHPVELEADAVGLAQRPAMLGESRAHLARRGGTRSTAHLRCGRMS